MSLNEISSDFFSELEDHEFYSDRVTHIYFYDEVSPESVANLQSAIHDAQGSKVENNISFSPKPIVLHLDSPGGDASYGLSLVNTLSEIRVPFAVVVDGYACSAITPLLVSAPYRVMNEYSMVLIHEGYSANRGKDGNYNFTQEIFDKYHQRYMQIYRENTKISEEMLQDLVTRDKFMGSKDCLKLEIVDRVLVFNKEDEKKAMKKYYKEHKEYDIPKNELLLKSNLNHIFSVNKNIDEIVAKMLFYSIGGDHVKPIVFHINQNSEDVYSLHEMVALMVNVHMIRVPTIGVIDNGIDIISAIPYITCQKRYIYEGTIMYINLLSYHLEQGENIYYKDMIENFELYRKIIFSILGTYTRIPKRILTTLFEKRVIFSAQECLEYGLVDDIIKVQTRGKKNN
jgi:ATP-dependent protease ClpP protease subunit